MKNKIIQQELTTLIAEARKTNKWIYSEGEVGKIMLELGWFGFVLWYVMRIAIIVALWRTYRSIKSLLLRQLALTAFLIHGVMISMHMVFLSSFMIYYWFLAGFIYLLPKLDELQTKKLKEKRALL